MQILHYSRTRPLPGPGPESLLTAGRAGREPSPTPESSQLGKGQGGWDSLPPQPHVGRGTEQARLPTLPEPGRSGFPSDPDSPWVEEVGSTPSQSQPWHLTWVGSGLVRVIGVQMAAHFGPDDGHGKPVIAVKTLFWDHCSWEAFLSKIYIDILPEQPTFFEKPLQYTIVNLFY